MKHIVVVGFLICLTLVANTLPVSAQVTCNDYDFTNDGYTLGTTQSDLATDLAAAIDCANQNQTDDTINVNGTVSLTAIDNVTDGNNGLPTINTNITINGNNNIIERGFTTCSDADSDPDFRLFNVQDGGGLTLNDLTLQNGCLTVSNDAGSGAAIYAEESQEDTTVTLNNVTVQNNTSGDDAVVRVAGTLTVVDSLIQNNAATDQGGGIYALDKPLVILNTTITQNRVLEGPNGGGQDGGGIFILSTQTIIANSTISYNEAGDWSGGIQDQGETLTIVNTTIIGNTAGNNHGAAYLSPNSSANVINSTIVGNSAGSNNGGINWSSFNNSFALYNTVLSGNTANGAESNCSGDVDAVDARNNILGHSSNSGACTGFANGSVNNTTPTSDLGTIIAVDGNGDPLLANNGGAIQTVALAVDSPAINYGDDTLLPVETVLGVDIDADTNTDDPIDVDQRGDANAYPRVIITVDAGAFEAFIVVGTDVNNDGVVSPADAVYVVNRIDSNDFSADVDGDGDVDTDDLNAVSDELGRFIN